MKCELCIMLCYMSAHKQSNSGGILYTVSVSQKTPMQYFVVLTLAKVDQLSLLHSDNNCGRGRRKICDLASNLLFL